MAVTITERLIAVENDVNRMLEMLQEAVTVEDASKHVAILDDENDAILYRITSLENKLEALRYKWQLAYKKVNS